MRTYVYIYINTYIYTYSAYMYVCVFIDTCIVSYFFFIKCIFIYDTLDPTPYISLSPSLSLSVLFRQQVVQELMKKLNAISDTTYYLRDFVPLNLFLLDNRHVKESLRMYVRSIYDFIIDFYRALNINENRA